MLKWSYDCMLSWSNACILSYLNATYKLNVTPKEDLFLNQKWTHLIDDISIRFEIETLI